MANMDCLARTNKNYLLRFGIRNIISNLQFEKNIILAHTAFTL